MSVSVKNYTVEATEIQKIRPFVENWHYSKSVNGIRVTQCFALLDRDHLIGAMIYGGFGMANAWKKYAQNETDVVELRRLCCIDDTLKNTESYFIGKTLKWLQQNTQIKTVISYADTNQGHKGTIYKASNFEYLGLTAKGKIIVCNDKRYHDKSIRTYYTNSKGEKQLKPFAIRLRQMLENGEAEYKTTLPKHIYKYELKKSQKL